MSSPFSILKKISAEVRAVFDEHRLARDEHRLTRLQRSLHFCFLVGRSFVDNRCLVRASALSYTTLLAMIPLLAVGLTFANGFLKGDDAKIDDWINAGLNQVAPQLSLVLPPASTNAGKTNLVVSQPVPSEAAGTNQLAAPTPPPAGNPDARKQILKFVHHSINGISNSIDSKNGLMRTIATIALLFVGISLLSTVETTLNDIWGVRRGRSWISRIIQYWAAITLGPLLLLAALGLNISSHFAMFRVLFGSTMLNLVSQVVPIVLVVTAFTLFYQLMPNTKVHFKAALVGGLVGGILLHLNHTFSAVYAGQVLRTSTVYGSLSIVPIFMVGTYISWVIVLFGAQVSYACQNRRVYLQEKLADDLNQNGREFVALRLMTLIAARFQRGDRPATVSELSDTLGLPSRLTIKTLQILVQNRLLVEVSGLETAYAPAQPLDKISFQSILKAMRAGYGQDLATRDDPARKQIQASLQKIERAENSVAEKITLNEPFANS